MLYSFKAYVALPYGRTSFEPLNAEYTDDWIDVPWIFRDLRRKLQYKVENIDGETTSLL